MGGAAWQPTGSAVGRLVLLVALVAGAVGWGTTPVAAVPTEGCSGDEVVLLAPASPHAGEPLFVAAISWYPHDLARFTGPTGPLLAEHQVLGDLHFWQAWMVPEWAGEQAFSFVVTDGADTVIAACASAVALVGDAPATPDGLASVAAGANPPSSDPSGTEASTPTPTSTRTPTPRPTRQPTDTPAPTDTARPTREPTDTPEPTRTRRPTETSSTTNAASAADEPAPTDTPRPTHTPRPTATNTPSPTSAPLPTAPLGPPAISGVQPEPATCGQQLSIRGQNFGSNRAAVDGDVSIDGHQSFVHAWSNAEIVVTVPLTANGGPQRPIVVTVAGRQAQYLVRMNC